MKVFSPAKINIFLNVRKKRQDGFHEIETVMQALDFGDNIAFNFNQTKKIEINSSSSSFPSDENNLIWKATKLFYEKTGIEFPGITYSVEKNIPIAGGLGGGSSNAITVLTALNEYYEKPLNFSLLMDISSKLGSDTTFFLKPSTWFCKGRGEILKNELESKRWTYLLVCPKIHCYTKKVYSSFIFDLTKNAPNPSVLQLSVCSGSLEEFEHSIFNNLKEAIFREYSGIKELVTRIKNQASKNVFISGSGSTLFMVFNNEEQAISVKKLLESNNKDGVRFILAHTLSDIKLMDHQK